MAKEEIKDKEEVKDDDVEEETPDEIDEQDQSKKENESEDDDEFEKRYPQFKGESLEEYTQRLEEAYEKSTTEGKRLADENEGLKTDKLKVIANETDDDDSEEVVDSFGDRFARTQVRKDNRQAFDSFVENHAELTTDPALTQRLKGKVATLAKSVVDEGEIPDMGELLRGAWAMLNVPSSDTDVDNAVKEQTGSSKTSSAKKRSKNSQFTPAQIATAKKMYPGKSEKDIVALLSKYNN